MYAVIESGGKQHRVELGTELAVDRLAAQPGDTITFEQVLLVADGESAAIGRPRVAGATVSAAVVRQERGEKIVVFKYRPKARHRSKNGARAELTLLRITDIVHDGRSAAKLAEAARTERERLEEAAAEAAAKQAEADKALARKLAAATAVEAPEAAPKTRRRAAKDGSADVEAESAPSAETGAKGAKAKTAGQARGAAKPATKSGAKATGPAAKAKPERGPSSRSQAPQPPQSGRGRTKKEP